jgi:SAM-dependent methyltransferase
MPPEEILNYFDVTANRETRDDLRLAVSLIEGDKVAIDCGCGAGSDISFLRSHDFFVHAFDIESESISRCRARFKDDSNVLLSHSSFNTFKYPNVSLIVADASLFFCPEDEFSEVWCKITNALIPNGVFSGSFLGPEDTMAGPSYNKESYWPDVLIFSKEKVKNLFNNYKIESFTEHKTSGKTPDGQLHQWHIYSVVAKKESNKALKL